MNNIAYLRAVFAPKTINMSTAKLADAIFTGDAKITSAAVKRGGVSFMGEDSDENRIILA